MMGLINAGKEAFEYAMADDEEWVPKFLFAYRDGKSDVTGYLGPIEGLVHLMDEYASKGPLEWIAATFDIYAYIGPREQWDGQRPRDLFAQGDPNVCEALSIHLVNADHGVEYVALPYERGGGLVNWRDAQVTTGDENMIKLLSTTILVSQGAN